MRNIFNTGGDVIRIVTAKLKSGNAESIGYEVKFENILQFLKQAGVSIDPDSTGC